MKFTTTVLSSGKTATGLPVPESVVEALDRGKRIPVVVTINGYSYRSSIVFYTGQYLIALSAENRAGAGVAAGDEIQVDVEPDDAPREVEVPSELAGTRDGCRCRRRVRRTLVQQQTPDRALDRGRQDRCHPRTPHREGSRRARLTPALTSHSQVNLGSVEE